MKRFKVKIWKNIPYGILGFGNDISSDKDYMWVYVFDSYDEMYDTVDRLEKCKIKRDYSGRCFCFTRIFVEEESKERTYDSLCGYIYFVKENMGGATVSHECSHATIGYFNRKIKEYNNIFEKFDDRNEKYYDDCHEHEELFCYILGSLVNQVYNYYYKNIFKE